MKTLIFSFLILYSFFFSSAQITNSLFAIDPNAVVLDEESIDNLTSSHWELKKKYRVEFGDTIESHSLKTYPKLKFNRDYTYEIKSKVFYSSIKEEYKCKGSWIKSNHNRIKLYLEPREDDDSNLLCRQKYLESYFPEYKSFFVIYHISSSRLVLARLYYFEVTQ